MDKRIKILFLCTGNACRSQMAEAWTNHLKGDQIHAVSAGVTPHGIDPLVVKVMAEVGVDVSGQTSKSVDVFRRSVFDCIITVCQNARSAAPILPKSDNIIHQGFDDPPALAGNIDDPEKQLDCYRKVRDQIKIYIQGLPRRLDLT